MRYSRAMRNTRESVLARVEAGPGGCLMYTGAAEAEGYCRVTIDGERRLVHRVAYEYHVGPIPDGLTVDHLCHNADAMCPGGPKCRHRRCVNPEHLEAVPSAENRSRASRRRTHCSKGHELAVENLWVAPDGERRCRICYRAAAERYRRRKGARPRP